MRRHSTRCIENEALKVENRLLKREVRTLLDTIKCAGEVLENLVKENEMRGLLSIFAVAAISAAGHVVLPTAIQDVIPALLAATRTTRAAGTRARARST